MNKLMAFFMFTFIAGTIIGFLMEGGSGIVATSTTDLVTSSQDVIPVTSVTGFKSSGDRIVIGNESMTYASLQVSGINDGKTCPCFVGVSRGVLGNDGKKTTATAHAGPGNQNGNATLGARVYNRGSAMVNESLDFNLIGSDRGFLGTIVGGYEDAKKLASMAAKIITWDFAFLEGDFSYFKYILLYPLSAGFVATIIVISANTIRGIFN